MTSEARFPGVKRQSYFGIFKNFLTFLTTSFANSVECRDKDLIGISLQFVCDSKRVDFTYNRIVRNKVNVDILTDNVSDNSENVSDGKS